MLKYVLYLGYYLYIFQAHVVSITYSLTRTHAGTHTLSQLATLQLTVSASAA
jgi:hypothetical protein